MKRLLKQNDKLEFKQETIRRVEVEGRRQADVAYELGIIEQTLHDWRKAHLAPLASCAYAVMAAPRSNWRPSSVSVST